MAEASCFAYLDNSQFLARAKLMSGEYIRQIFKQLLKNISANKNVSMHPINYARKENCLKRVSEEMVFNKFTHQFNHLFADKSCRIPITYIIGQSEML